MNKLSYKIKEQIPSDCYPNAFKAVIDGIETDYYFDVAALEVSQTLGGIFPMLICPCGYIACTGYYVWSYMLPNKIVWSNFYPCIADEETAREDEGDKEVYLLKNFDGKGSDFIVNPPLSFDREEYRRLVADMISQLHLYPREQAMFNADIDNYRSGHRFHM